MQKYRVGLGVIALLVVGLSIYVLTLGAGAKQDKQTYEKANDMATKLNNWISTNRKVPENLGEAGINDLPDTIKYTKKDSSRYEVCVTYKAARSYGGSDVFNAFYGGGLSSGVSLDDYEESSYESSSLYFSYVHKKGENCQTVKPYISTYNSYYDSNTRYNDDTEIDYSSDEYMLESYKKAQETYCVDADSRATYKSYCDSIEEYIAELEAE